MFITDPQSSPLKHISDISGNLAYRGQIISGGGGGPISTVSTSNELLTLDAAPGALVWVSALSRVALCIASPSSVFSSWRWWSVSAPVSGWRYIRLNMSAPANYLEILECRLLVGSTRYPTTNMTSDATPTPLVASASSSLGGGFEAYRACDSDVTTSRWHSNNSTSSWWQIDLGAGNEISPTGLVMACYLGGGNRYPSTIEVRGSNDAFTTSDVIATISSTGTWQNAVEKTFTW